LEVNLQPYRIVLPHWKIVLLQFLPRWLQRHKNLPPLDEKTNSIEEALESKANTDSISDATKSLSSDITSAQNAIKPLADKIEDLESTLSSLKSEEDDSSGELQKTVDFAISALKDELSTMNTAIKKLSDQPSVVSNTQESSN